MHKVKRLGIAESLDFYSLTYNSTKATIRKVLEDPKYLTNVQKLSKQFKDQKETPLERACWWIEWLLRNPNVDQLKSPVHRLGFVAGNSFDVIAFAAVIFTFLILLTCKLFCVCFRKTIQRISCTSTKHYKSISQHYKQS